MPLTRATHVIHDLRPGGAEHVLVDLAGVARRAGIDLSVVSMLPIEGLLHARHLERAGVPVRSLGLRAWWDPRGPRRMRRALRELEPHVVHTHLKHADVIGGRAASRLGIPHVSTLHVMEEVDGVARWKRDLAVRSRARTAARTIAVSEALRRWYLETFAVDPDTVMTLRNGVPDPGPADVDLSDRIRTGLGVPEHALMAVTVAVMRPRKGHDVLVEAIHHLDDPSTVFVLAGDGDEAPRLREMAAGNPRIVFAGYREDVPALLAASDFVVQPSLADALPTALIHALAASRPIVASDVGGVPEIVPVDGGLLVPPGDPIALADAIDRMVVAGDTRRWMGKRARERFDAEFEATAWARRLHDIYAELLITH